jgi:Holliday junction DNA helicase RuvB
MKIKDSSLYRSASAQGRRLFDQITPPPLPQDEPAVNRPMPTTDRSHNPLRPSYLADMIGQDQMRALLLRLIAAAKAKGRPLDHMALVAPSGYGKTTVANCIANEMGTDVYQVEAPVSHETLMALREVMQDGDILFLDEMHQQGIMDRRSRDSSTQPEVLFSVMEDRTIIAGSGVLSFPAITVIGATTDEGRLPDPFLNRFPIRPEYEPYSIVDLSVMADVFAQALGATITTEAAIRFAYACRGVPRVLGNFVRNAEALATGAIDEALAIEVIEDLNHTTEDGLTLDMQKALVFLYQKCRQRRGDGTIVYKSGVGAIARAIGKSRDVKAVELRVEPYLIEQGYLQVGHGGRFLTDNGVTRAVELLKG